MIQSRWKRGIALALAGILLLGASSAEPVKAAEQKTVYAGENGIPMVSYFYPEELLKWNPAKDKDLIYQKATVPLAKRVASEKLTIRKDGQSKDMKVLAITIMNAGTSGNPAQGSNEFMGNANMFSYWQYIDTLVYWGGSAGEGIIVPPAPDVIDAAHRNGVPVLGTVFFPTPTHGGKLEWLKQMLVKDKDGSFKAADQLLLLAEEIGFDGWFINQETEGTSQEDAQLMQEFIQYMKKKAPDFQVYWYDSMTKDGSMDWQNALTDQNEMFLVDGNGKSVADSMFLNFWWTNKSYVEKELLKASKTKAKEIGVSNYDLYAGVDVQAEGTNTPIRWDLFTDEAGTPYTSLGLYCPSWTYYSAGKDAMLFQKQEQELWAGGNLSVDTQTDEKQTNANQTDTGTPDTSWDAVSNYAVEKSPLTKAPFVTNFSMGHGKVYYKAGKKVGNTEWNNRSVQDIMPTYRFSIGNSGKTQLDAAIDYSKAYNGGNSILVSGNLSKNSPATMDLYAADLTIAKNTNVTITVKNAESLGLNLVVTLEDGKEKIVKGKAAANGTWKKTTYSLKAYEGKKIRSLGVQFSAAKDKKIAVSLGQLTIINGNAKAASIQKASVKGVYSKDSIRAGARIQLKSNSQTAYYEIYQTIQGKDQFAGITVNPNYYISQIARDGKATKTSMKAIAISTTGVRSKAAVFQIPWDTYPVPKAGFTISKTYIAPGESVQLTSKASETTEKVSWKLPGSNLKTSNKKNVTAVYEKEGVYTVTFTASNTSGKDQIVKKNLIYVSKQADKIANLSADCPVIASGQANEKEAGEFAVDDSIKTKWCAVGSAPHTIVLDLQKTSRIGEIIISHAEAGGEGASSNTRGFHVETSLDGEQYQKVAAVSDNTEAVSHTAFAPVTARYVKIVIDQPTQGADQAARIYDIQVMGTTEE